MEIILRTRDDGWAYDSKKANYCGISWNIIFGIGCMWSNFTNTIVENRVASSNCDPSFVVCIGVFAVGAVEEPRWPCGNDWAELRNRHSDNYLGT